RSTCPLSLPDALPIFAQLKERTFSTSSVCRSLPLLASQMRTVASAPPVASSLLFWLKLAHRMADPRGPGLCPTSSARDFPSGSRSEEHTSALQSPYDL